MKKFLPKILVLLLIGGLFFLIKRYGLQEYLTLNYLKENLASFKDFDTKDPIWVISTFMGIYILTTALSIQGAIILTLGAGALFGFVPGLIIVSFSSSIGATLAFLTSRFLLRESVQEKFSERLKKINKGIKE